PRGAARDRRHHRRDALERPGGHDASLRGGGGRRRHDAQARDARADGRERRPHRARDVPVGGAGGSRSRAMSVSFGRAELPEKQRSVLHRAIRLEWITIAFLAVTVTLVFLVLGNSQAMKAAWIE